MLILITPDALNHTHYPVLQQAIKMVDKLHIKIQWTDEHPIKQAQYIVHQINPDNQPHLKEKIVLHLNELFFQRLDTSHSSYTHISKQFFTDILSQLSSLGIHHFHLSEQFFNQYHSTLPQEFFHQYNISTSLHHLNLQDIHPYFSYIIYGPVFKSISKHNYIPSQTIEYIQEKLEYIRQEMGIPIIAISGIHPQNFTKALEIGFDGVAIRGYIWESPSSLDNLLHFINEWKKYKNL